MIESVLIANRGEIARRIIRTAKRLGIRTIAVYSEADVAAAYVREADVAVPIGAAPARESYLCVAHILRAARETGASAIHPGYGFLSENAEFAEAVQAAGLVWVGAPPAAIRAMGRKDSAKALMLRAGVPVTPGYLGASQDAQELRQAADAIGYPVLIKAVAGGGGKGMRRVDRADEFAAALDACRREAAAAFGDERVLLEKYVLLPRHIEVQVFADTQGNVVHLFERDCSIQRRHQKVIEESPAPGMDDQTREFLCGIAVTAAKAVGYVGAGTVEFIADASEGLRADRLWFMEMNTRLQVEHPVTEAVTGQDLVEWQLRIAAGEPLPRRQSELALRGWAMEARLYAENPAAGFLPSTGPLRRLRLPPNLRIDSGVEEGDEVTAFYDPMLAKLIVHAPTRAGAAALLAAACGAVQVWPVKTNAAFLARLAADPAFVAAAIDTGFIARHAARLITEERPSAEVIAGAARALIPPASGDPWNGLVGFRANAAPYARALVALGDKLYTTTLESSAPATTGIEVADVEGERVLFWKGEAWRFAVPNGLRVDGSARTSDGTLRSPMPGRVVKLLVSEGDAVVAGQMILVLEAMKMEHTIVAPFAGVVADLGVTSGDQVAESIALVRILRATETPVA
jgi:3-methylcrotonyl-CoA carboxylase alpha subunit